MATFLIFINCCYVSVELECWEKHINTSKIVALSVQIDSTINWCFQVHLNVRKLDSWPHVNVHRPLVLCRVQLDNCVFYSGFTGSPLNAAINSPSFTVAIIPLSNENISLSWLIVKDTATQLGQLRRGNRCTSSDLNFTQKCHLLTFDHVCNCRPV